MTEPPLSICEECGGKIERIITGGTGLIFKGSGFYLTDYNDEKKKSVDPSDDIKKNQNKTEKSEKKNNLNNKKDDNQSIPKKTDE